MNICLLLQSKKLVLWERIFEMGNTSEQIFNIIPLVKYRDIGSFPSVFVPTLPNDTFVIISTQPSNMPGEHWIMITINPQVMYFANPFGLYVKNCLFPKQKCRQMIPTKLQGLPSVCSFYTIHAAFHLFMFQQKDFTGNNDVNVLSFLSSYM